MNSSITFQFNSRAQVCALTLTALLFIAGAPVRAQNGQQDMQNMPGMGKQKAEQQKKKPPQPAPKKDEMQGMDMKGMKMPSPTPTPSPTPAPSPEKMEMNMPVSPSQQGPVTDTLKPNATEDKSGGMGNMDMNNMENGGSGDESMKGMSDMSGMGSMNMGPLLVVSGNDMSIRVGSSRTNVMPMGQMGSGTSWEPASSPMRMYHKVAGDWLLMLHFNLIGDFNSQGGPRGVTKFESLNWFMPMAFHKLGRGTLALRGMFSLEPFTFPPGGSPELFQTGETYKGRPLIDRQHPHNLFMELSSTYTLALGEHGTWFTYFGYPGEPALGPVAFMHRWSAAENPAAPLAHHLQDSTHISFGVLTSGFTYRKLKLEGSIFNGREPGENRYTFEAHRWNSRSARLSFAPNGNWSMQVSYGLLKKPEALEPGDIRRATASVSYNRPFNRGNWATSLIWGRNHLSGPGETANLNGYTAESTVNFLDRNYLYTRLELVDKNELLRPADRALLGIAPDAHPSLRVGAYTFGGARDIWNTSKLSMAIGGDVVFYSMPSALNPIYGHHPVSYHVFFRIRPGKMSMDHHGSMHGEVMNGAMGNMSGGMNPLQQ